MLQYNITKMGDAEVITVFVPTASTPVRAADTSHPNYDAIVAAAKAGDEDVMSLFDVAETVGIAFAQLSERVTARSGRVYFDDDEIDTSIAKQIIRALDEDGLGADSVKALVAFMEKVAANPQEHSRAQLFDWLDKHEFTITPEGDIVGYKGVRDGRSIHSGAAYVNGTLVTGRIPYAPGDVVTMPRSEVQHDPTVGCHKGLHVGTFEYASGFASELLEVHVSPRDVVSVPTDCNWQKVRACRLEVVGPVKGKYGQAILHAESDLDEDDPDEIVIGSRVVDSDGDYGTVTAIDGNEGVVDYDDYGQVPVDLDDLELADEADDEDDPDVALDAPVERRVGGGDTSPQRRSGERNHGKGGATSFAAKGRGRNAAQDAKGRFSAGRPGSARDGSGRFV